MPAPVGNTCPTIDRVIEELEASSEIAKDFSDNISSKTYGDVEEAFEDIYNSIHWLPSLLEDLRSANSELRSWGEESEERAEELESEVENLKSQLEDAQELIDSLTEQLERGE